MNCNAQGQLAHDMGTQQGRTPATMALRRCLALTDAHTRPQMSRPQLARFAFGVQSWVQSLSSSAYHVIPQDAPLSLSILPEQELHASALVRSQVAVDDPRNLHPQLLAWHRWRGVSDGRIAAA